MIALSQPRTHGRCPDCQHYGSDCQHYGSDCKCHLSMPTTPLNRVLSEPLVVMDDDRASVRIAAGRYHVTTISMGMNDREAYARLFAAAPKLFAALQELMKDDGAVNCGIGNARPVAQRKFIAAAQAAKDALAEAGGKS